jgi:hypothetical protein
VLLVDDVFKNEARISDDEFEWNWDTIGELEGYKEIEVFIVNEHAPFSIGKRISEDWQKKEGVDASATIFLLPPRFSMTVQECIAEGDDVIISGEATGTDNVYIIVINSKGDVVFPPARIAKVTLVEEGEWEETLDELDRGRYVVISVHKGKDGETNAIKENGAWVAGSEGKTSEQRIEILTDALSSAGSDDLFEKTYFSVSTPKVSLKVPETVEIDEEINVTAETNIRECEKAFVSILLAQNSTIIKKTSAFVKNGGMNASINTSGLLPGIYNISVDIRERAHDEKEIILVEKREQEGEGEDEEESLTQNESLPESGSAEKANESVGTKDNEGGSKEISPKGYGGERKVLIPVNIWDLLIAIIVATSISIATRQRRR